MAENDNKIMESQHQQRLGIMPKAAMDAGQGGVGSGELLISEILTKVNNAKDKAKKIQVLKDNDSSALRMVLKGSFDPNIKWALPTGTPPYMANEAPIGTEHTLLRNEAKRLWHFVDGADPETTKTQKETMYIQILEGLSKVEAQVLLDMKDKKLNKVYKGLSESVVREAFGWNDNFVKPEQK
tara:strand:- start:366 stop:914 length:549 start_codon:yes stop_codon:yes gene_type:complete